MKTNKKFLLLSFWGIIFVVLGHCSGLHKNMFFCNIFPFYSFHMALFIFISGYFYKKSPAKKFFVKKTKKIIISYLIWNLIYGIIVNILKNLGVINYGKDLTLYNIFIAPFMTYSNQFHFNSPAWFLISIYFVQVIYCIIDKINIKDYKINKYIVFIISSIIASITLKSALNGNNYGIWILITRVSFLFPFYCLGQIYKDLEKYDKLNNIAYYIILIIVQAILLQKYVDLTYNLNTMTFKHPYIIYLLSSITGILFWLRISAIMEPYFGENKIINYIGNNTYHVMMHHMFMFYIVNTFIYAIYKFTGRFGKFDVTAYKKSIWYVYNKENGALLLIYVIIGIALPLLIKYMIIDKYQINQKFKDLFEKCKKTIIKDDLNKDIPVK